MNTTAHSRPEQRDATRLQVLVPSRGDRALGLRKRFTIETAGAIATEWIAAWNAHDLNRIMSQYAPEVEYSSPLVPSILGEGQAKLRGLSALRQYFTNVLAAHPELVFRLCHVYVGFDSLVVEYLGVENLHTSETMTFDRSGHVRQAITHFRPSGGPVIC
jgi:hypothetical protein